MALGKEGWRGGGFPRTPIEQASMVDNLKTPSTAGQIHMADETQVYRGDEPFKY